MSSNRDGLSESISRAMKVLVPVCAMCACFCAHARRGDRLVPVDPLLDRVDAATGEMMFYWNGDGSLCGSEVSGRMDGTAAATGRLGADRRVKLAFGALASGEHRICVSMGAVTNTYTITAVPRAARRSVGRKLNNFVTEVLSVPLSDGKTQFFNPREGWVFIGFDRPCRETRAFLDGSSEPVVEFRESEPSETMRWLKEGSHEIEIKGAQPPGVLSVRLVKMMRVGGSTFANEKTDISIGRMGYGWDFFRRWQLASFNTLSLGANWRLSNGATPQMLKGNAELSLRGKRPVASTGVRPLDLELRKDWERVRGRFVLHPGYLDGLALGLDENRVNAPADESDAVAEAMWELTAERKDQPLYACYCDVPAQSLTNYPAQAASLSAILNSGRGFGMLQPEMYIGTRLTEEGMLAQEETAIKLIESFRRIMPDAPSHTMHLLSGWLTVGGWSNYCSSEVDIKVLYDHYVRRLATDPAFHDVGGVGMSSLVCNEEIARWTARIIHHYGIEGRTDSLAERFGYRYRPEIVKDGDFLKEFSCWKAEAAEKDSLRHEHRKGYGGKKGQVRMSRESSRLGEHFALFTRSAKAPNRLSQHVKGLVPGKYYALTYCLADYDDVCDPGSRICDGAVFETLSGFERVPRLTFETEAPAAREVLRAKKQKKPVRCRTITRRYVLKAVSDESDIVFSDWKTDAEPGAEPGRRNLVNYISLNPYYIESEDELHELERMSSRE